MPDLILEQREEEKKFFSKTTGIHLFGYSLVGGITNCIEIGFLFILVEVMHFWYLLAAVIVFTFGSMFSFTLRKVFVFKKKCFYSIYKQFASYIFIFLIGLVVNSIIMTFFVEILKVYYVFAYIMSVLITGVVGFLWNKKVTFKE